MHTELFPLEWSQMEVNIYAVRKQVHKAIVEYCTYEFRTLSSFIGNTMPITIHQLECKHFPLRKWFTIYLSGLSHQSVNTGISTTEPLSTCFIARLVHSSLNITILFTLLLFARHSTLSIIIIITPQHLINPLE